MLCVRGFVFYGLCCLFEIGAGLSRVSMPPLMIACSSKRSAPTVFKCVWHVLDATLDQPGTAMQTRLRPGAQACTVSTRSGAVCVRGFVFLGVCCLFEIGAGLSRVSIPPLMIAGSSKRGAATVFECVWHVSVLQDPHAISAPNGYQVALSVRLQPYHTSNTQIFNWKPTIYSNYKSQKPYRYNTGPLNGPFLYLEGCFHLLYFWGGKQRLTSVTQHM